MSAKGTYKVVVNDECNRITVSEALDKNHWFGYASAGGTIRILVYADGKYAFCGKVANAMYASSNVGRSVLQAVAGGIDVRSSASLESLIAELSHV